MAASFTSASWKVDTPYRWAERRQSHPLNMMRRLADGITRVVGDDCGISSATVHGQHG